MSDFLSSPSSHLLWAIRKGSTLYRAPLAEDRRCYVVQPDGSQWTTYQREVSDLEKRGLIAALPKSDKDEPTRYEVTQAGMEFPL